MDDLIRRQAAIEAIRKLYPGKPMIDIDGERWWRWRKENNQYIECEEVIKALSSVKLEEKSKKGWWGEFVPGLYRCSECGRFSPTRENFCPDCGADLRIESQWTI